MPGCRSVSACCEHRTHRARGAERGRRAGSADADDPVGGTVARERALRRLWQGDAAHPGPARARHAVWADQRGDDHRPVPPVGAFLPRAAADPLSYPVEVPRRGAAAVRRDAGARVPDEGRVFVRPGLCRRGGELSHDDAGLYAHLPAHGAEGDPDGGGQRPDRRRPQPRVHHPGADRREPGVLRRRFREDRLGQRAVRLQCAATSRRSSSR